MGRRKIQIAPITDDRNRNVTFGKRRNGLFKKAYELGVLCSVDVAVLVWGHNGKLFAFSSQGSLKGVVDRYHSQSQDECDVIGPAHYGGEINPATLLSGGGGVGSEMNGISGSSNRNKSGGGGVKKRRRSDDDSDDDDDDDDDGDDGGMLDAPSLNSMSNSNQHGLSTSAPASSLPHDMGGLFPNGSPSSHANMHRYNQSQQHQQQQQHQNHLQQHAQHLQNLQQAQQQQHPHSALSSHPFFGNYPYPGYPHHMPNVNPALGNPLGFYAPSAAAMAAAAAATGQYGAYGAGAAALPPHLLRAATVAQQYAQQETGSSGSTPSSAGNNVQNNSNGNGNGNGNSAGYAPIVRSPPPMDMSQQQQQQQQGESSSNGYGNQSQQQLSPRSGGGRKPSLHLSFSSNNHRSSGHPSGSQGPSRNSSMNENDNSQQQQQYNQLSQQEQQQQQQQHAALLEEAAVVSAYAEQAGLTVPGAGNGPGGMQFPDSFLTSPSQLFPEIYRSMNSYAESQAHRAMTFGAENTPTADEDEGDNARNVFRWPTLGGGGSGGGVSNGGISSSQNGGNGGSNVNGSNTPRSQDHANSTTDATSHLRINGQTEVKREGDGNESDTIAELAMS